jgi:hypothetical protein
MTIQDFWKSDPEQLKVRLEKATLGDLRRICKLYALDFTGRYRRMKSPELVEFILQRREAILARGKCFLS